MAHNAEKRVMFLGKNKTFYKIIFNERLGFIKISNNSLFEGGFFLIFFIYKFDISMEKNIFFSSY